MKISQREVKQLDTNNIIEENVRMEAVARAFIQDNCDFSSSLEPSFANRRNGDGGHENIEDGRSPLAAVSLPAMDSIHSGSTMSLHILFRLGSALPVSGLS